MDKSEQELKGTKLEGFYCSHTYNLRVYDSSVLIFGGAILSHWIASGASSLIIELYNDFGYNKEWEYLS